MEQRIRITGAEPERPNKGAQRARAWARVFTFVLFGLCLSAIWQEKRLAPPVHDGMVRLTDLALDYINQSESLSAALVEFQAGYEKLLNDG